MTTIRLNGPNTTASSVINLEQRLGGIDLRFRLQWMITEEYWVISVADENGVAILSAMRLIEGNNIFAPFSDIRLPVGRLICYDTTNLHEEPGRDDLVNRHIIVFTDLAEVEEDTDFVVEAADPPHPPPPVEGPPV